ncbi:unnamed protein product [Calypogeia fissa]
MVKVPNFFICPISLQIMKDPVTLITGQTYDRSSIEKWFAAGHNTCPSTMQVLPSMDIAPNHTLKSLIQQWCTTNNSCNGAAVEEVVHVMRPFTNEAKRRPVVELLKEVAKRGVHTLHNLKKLRCLAKDLDQGTRNRVVLVEAGAIPVLANFIFCPDSLGKDVHLCEEALGILILLSLQDIRKVVQIGTKQLTAMSWLLNRGSIDGRVNAAVLLGSLAHEDNEMKAAMGNTAGIFEGLVQLLKEDLYLKAADAGLKTILSIIANGPHRNIVRAVEVGVVFAVVDRLLETERRGQVQILTKLMELLCSTPEGRQAVTAHALVVPLLVRIIVSNIPVVAESAVSCLWTICQHSPSKRIDEAAGQVGMVTHLSRLVESADHQISARTRQRAAHLLNQVQHSLRNCAPRC